MPKSGKKKESNLEFQKRTFPSRLKVVEQRSAEVLGKRGAVKRLKGPPTKGERASAEKAQKAVGRIKKRLGIKKKGVSMGDKIGKTVAGLKDLFSFGKRVAKAPGAFKGLGQ